MTSDLCSCLRSGSVAGYRASRDRGKISWRNLTNWVTNGVKCGWSYQYGPYLGLPGNWRVLRGGSWINNQNNARAAYRNNNHPDNRNNNNGFRVVVVRRSTTYFLLEGVPLPQALARSGLA